MALLGKWSLGVGFESVRPHPTSSLLSLLHACSLRSELPAFCHGFLLRWTLTPLEQQGQTSSLFFKLPWWFNNGNRKVTNTSLHSLLTAAFYGPVSPMGQYRPRKNFNECDALVCVRIICLDLKISHISKSLLRSI